MLQHYDNHFRNELAAQNDAVKVDFNRRWDMAKAVDSIIPPIWKGLDVNSNEIKECNASKLPAVAKFLIFGSAFVTAAFLWIGEKLGSKSIVWPYIVGLSALMTISLLIVIFYRIVPLFIEREVRRLRQLHSDLELHWLSAGATIQLLFELRLAVSKLGKLEDKLFIAWASHSSDEDQVRQQIKDQQAIVEDHWRTIRIELLERSSGLDIGGRIRPLADCGQSISK